MSLAVPEVLSAFCLFGESKIGPEKAMRVLWRHALRSQIRQSVRKLHTPR
jgi:hypothetical protein